MGGRPAISVLIQVSVWMPSVIFTIYNMSSINEYAFLKKKDWQRILLGSMTRFSTSVISGNRHGFLVTSCLDSRHIVCEFGSIHIESRVNQFEDGSVEQGLKHKNRNNCKFHHKVFHHKLCVVLAYKLSSGGATHFYCEMTSVKLTFKYVGLIWFYVRLYSIIGSCWQNFNI